MLIKCNIIKKDKNNEYLSCSDCKHSYPEELDNYALECELPYHWVYNWELEDELDEDGEVIDKICIDFKE